MRFIKKLVILTGGGARGTLMLEKNGYGVWCKLNLFDLRPNSYKFAILSGDDLFVMNIDKKVGAINFELGEINFDEIHAAVIADNKVVMYGSNCATKLAADVIMNRIKRSQKAKEEEASYITFSGRDKDINDYFKQIAPPLYNDFAIAEKNYYPAYVTLIDEAVSSVEEVAFKEQPPVAEKPKAEPEKKRPVRRAEIKKEILEERVNKKMTPHELEQKYLSLIQGASLLAKTEQVAATTEVEQPKETIEPTAESIAETIAETLAQEPPLRLTPGEKPEVIAMARRITLRDYRVEGAKKTTGRKATYFERSSAQLEKLMADNERFSAIEKLIPGSKFVKINYDQKRYYIVGVIGRDYICYGVPSVYTEAPPEPLCGYARWLPFDADKPYAEGFWMMYQDGVSGETLKS